KGLTHLQEECRVSPTIEISCQFFLHRQCVCLLPLYCLHQLPHRLNNPEHITHTFALLTRWVLFVCLLDAVLSCLGMCLLKSMQVLLLIAFNKMLFGVAGNDCVQLVGFLWYSLDQMLC